MINNDNRKWRCKSCGVISKEKNLLEAKSPFDPTDIINACPLCLQCADGFEEICDELYCKEITTCGWNTDNGEYRRTCSKHSLFTLD